MMESNSDAHLESSKKSLSITTFDNNNIPWHRRINAGERVTLTSILPFVLCVYAFVKEIKVIEPFVFKYQQEYLRFTNEELVAEVAPFNPYSYTLALVPIFLLTDLLLYKPTMVLEMIGQIVYRGSLVFGTSLQSQIIGQSFYGMASASELAFFSYSYAQLEKDQYQRLTGWTRACTMAGRTFGYLLAQTLVMTGMGNLRQLSIIALTMPSLMLLLCLYLPRVDWKKQAERIKSGQTGEQETDLPTYSSYVLYRLRKLRSDFTLIYSIPRIRKWSIYWAISTCMSLQVTLFTQSLWSEVQAKGDTALNGFCEAAYTASAALAILSMNALPLNWDRWGEVVLVAISVIDACILLLYSHTQNIYMMFACYVGYRSLFQVMISIAQFNIAKWMPCESYGLVFGVSSFGAVVLQSGVTMLVSDKRGLALPVRQQYLLYAAVNVIIGCAFACSAAVGLAGKRADGEVKVFTIEGSIEEGGATVKEKMKELVDGVDE